MKTKYLLSLILMSLSMAGFSKTWIINNSGTTFSPASITINSGDDVNFVLSSNHNAVEVSQSTWNAGGNSALPGFSIPFGGGTVPASQLTVGTHYFVCTPHASFGMKGTIIVQNKTDISEFNTQADVAIYPNPSTGMIYVEILGSQVIGNGKLEIFNVIGEKVFESRLTDSKVGIDLTNSSDGIYFVSFFDGHKTYTKKIIKQN